MNDDIKREKDDLREHARRTRSLLSLNADDLKSFSDLFFKNIDIKENLVVSCYWPIGREFDTHSLMDECIDRGAIIALPIVEADTKILKFVAWTPNDDVEMGAYGICQPVIDDKIEFIDPDIIVVPFLAFDRKGYRLGYGGGYYDTTIDDLRGRKNILTVGVGFSKQACLFNLPVEDHDVQLDWVITEQNAHKFT